jgi:anaerobic sulfite reductase subunit C
VKWDSDAEKAVRRAPFFVRKRVRAKVEEVAREAGAKRVTLAHVQAARDHYVRNMESEVCGYQVENCFGQSGCSHRAVKDDGLADSLEAVLAGADMLAFLKAGVQGPLKLHHEFRVTISDCPNACSRPQIADIGIIGARLPKVDAQAQCTQCQACVDACREKAVQCESDCGPEIDFDQCLACGQCIDVCPTGSLTQGETGYRVQLGGRLGRRPKLARELPGLRDPKSVPALVSRVVDFYKAKSRPGERLADLLEPEDMEKLGR